jgi:hypothetical protein
VLPEPLRVAAAALPLADLLEIVMDFGRPAEARLLDKAVPLGGHVIDRATCATCSSA